MKTPSYCYWSVADGDYARMFAVTIRSARQSGVYRDFHLWSDQPIEGAICHDAGPFQKEYYLFKLLFMRDAVSKLNYDYFIWLDTDTYFVRNPGDILRVMKGSPFHITLESDICLSRNKRRDWWDCPNQIFADLMRAKGVRSRSIFNVNAGLFIVHRDAVPKVFDLAFDFWDFCRTQGYAFTEEPLLAYAMHMLCGNPYAHTLRETADLWASDWTGAFAGTLPDGEAWWFLDYFTLEKLPVNPAIVHTMKSKDALVAAAPSCSSDAITLPEILPNRLSIP